MAMAMACTIERKTTPPNRNRWAGELLPELFELILKKLASNVLDIIRFKAVCSSWNCAAARSYTSAPLPQYPWLMPSIPKSPPIDHESRCFFSLAENKVYKMDWNWKKTFHGDGASCLGSSHGWLAIKEVNTEKKTYKEYEEIVHLFNPISRERLLAPKMTRTKKVVLSSDPSHNNNFVVVVIHSRFFEGTGLAFYQHGRGGDNAAAWTNLSHGSSCADMVFHNGHLFTLSIIHTIQVWDFRGTYDNNNYPMKIMNFRPSIDGNVNSMAVDEWLVESMGELLLVGQERLGNDTRGAVKFFVYKLNIAAKTFEQVESLRDCALFLARNQSAMSFSLSTKELPGLKENSIYFTDLDHVLKLNESCGDNFHEGRVYNLETKAVETYYPTRAPVSNPYWNSPPVWIVPSPWY
ncbi:putative F-box protein [Prunus yedoensis var. nudiflora]|uniref:Putative F-box protein n=1 Tax=Prunus yedoensis var. nudiflora TaxID=2094558 RepID=A0A314Y2B3_PRUYE|nr:putative F-box protein [Prunus yedoensis var. nudiflora]